VSYQKKRFRTRPKEELYAEIDWAAQEMPEAERVFLADGDALVLSTNRLTEIFDRLTSRLPNLKRITMYACPQNFKRKSVQDLRSLRDAGLTMLYVGAESGHDKVLERINKGVTSSQLVELCAKPMLAGIDLSITVILGLGGPDLSEAHAKATARVLDDISPRYASALTLMLEPRTPTFQEAFGDPTWRMLTPAESLEECRVLIDSMQADGVTFRSNHASNYLSLAGNLQPDKQRLLDRIDRALAEPDSPFIRPEFMRQL
jgi:radical SAM superfamily enzyme YgiQ (UPF0313 family)